MKKNILLGLFTFIFTASIFSQGDINFTSLTTKDGLSSNTVNAVLKDHFGFMWFCTEDGLNKFDGTNFKIYRHKQGDPSSLQSNEILSVYEDKAGNLWVGTSGGSVSLYDRKKDAFINIPSKDGQGFISNNVIRDICSDYRGKLWIAHFKGINILDPKTKQASEVPLATSTAGLALHTPAICLFEDSRHRMWIGTENGLFQYNQDKKSLTQFLHSDKDPFSLSGNHINTIAEDKENNLWIGTDGGLSMLKTGTSSFINYHEDGNNPKGLSSKTINSIAVDGKKLWLATGAGLNILNIETGIIQKFGSDFRNIHSLTAYSVRSVYIDNQGIYWLGMIGGGVNKYDKNLNLFNSVKSNIFDKSGLNVSTVSSFEEDGKGSVFVGTEGGGLSLFNPATRLFKYFNIQSRKKGSQSHLAVLAQKKNAKGQLILATFGDGLLILDPISGSYEQLIQGTQLNDLNSNYLFCIKQDHDGKLWIGTNGDGINVLDKDYKVVTRYTPNPKLPNDIKLPINGFIRDIEEDKQGNIWIATHGGGISMFNPTLKKFTIYNTDNSNLPNDKVQALLLDHSGSIWAGTFGGGVAVFDPSLNKFICFSENDGLQNNTIYEILEDHKGLVWVSSNKGISSIDIRTKKINNFNYHNGVQNNDFFHGAGIVLATGEIFFGGLDGINYFNPAYLKRNNNIPSVLITDLRISNQSVIPSQKGAISENISVAKKINLDYKQNFSLSFVALNYTSPEQNQYAYKLEGFDKDWNYVGNSTTASYTNLDPGEYVFRVKASNNDGVWNNEGASIRIYVHPPFWRTTYAYIFYVLIFLGSLLFIRRRSIQKLERKFALEQARMIAEQEKIKAEQQRKESERVHELDRLKIRFLTNLSHDFRTPISLILGPVDQLMSNKQDKQSLDQLNMIKRNGKRLLNLVNQLLDFRKMEKQELKLNLSEGELVSFIREVTDSFKDFSERKKIEFNYISEIDQFYTLFDQDKLERVLFNLLSNAFKFTLEGGKIILKLGKLETESSESNTWVAISISDTGIGIEPEKKHQIFERFFQIGGSAAVLNQGTGIGLSITQEFIKLHGGTINVESELGKGTTFSIRLPFRQMEVPKKESSKNNKESNLAELQDASPIRVSEPIDNTYEKAADEDASLNHPTNIPSILLVEDNEDFRFYLKENLRLHYRVLEAANGKEGWQKALSHHPMLIVSDINMPFMDGIELTQKIKSDKRTSHIPIILLTALTGVKDEIKGLETGANDYITKPFNFEVLNAKVKNLLELNTKLKNTYTKQIKVLTPETKVESENEKLLNEIMLYIETNLTDSQLSVEELSRHVGMSRSSLYSKLLELTGQTPVEYIRSVKLEKAVVLIEKSEMNVAQIAYSVGFATPNYFAKSFKSKFGMLPSEYMTKARKNNNGQNHN